MADENNMNAKDFLIGTLVGGLIGAATALLLSPKSGKQLREDLAEGYQTASQKTQEMVRTISEQTESIVSKVKDTVDTVREDIQEWKQITQNAESQPLKTVTTAVHSDAAGTDRVETGETNSVGDAHGSQDENTSADAHASDDHVSDDQK